MSLKEILTKERQNCAVDYFLMGMLSHFNATKNNPFYDRLHEIVKPYESNPKLEHLLAATPFGIFGMMTGAVTTFPIACVYEFRNEVINKYFKK